MMTTLLEDKCYDRTFEIGARHRTAFASKATRFTAPTRILTEVVSKSEEVFRLVSKPIDLSLEELISTDKYGNLLFHSFGAFHIAGECLNYQRLRWQLDPSDVPNPSSDPTLANRLNYGNAPSDSLREEFCLSAFFQVCLPHLRAADRGDYRTVEEATIQSLLSLSDAYLQYCEGSRGRIRTDVIAYWATGLGDVPDFEPEMPFADAGVSPKDNLRWIRHSYFAPEAPLSFVNLDLCARICAGRSRSVFTEMGKFLDRLRFGPDVRGAIHLLPGKTAFDLASESCRDHASRRLPTTTDWTERFPYYLPECDDSPPYTYFEKFLNALALLNQAICAGSCGRSHPIFTAFQKEDGTDLPPTGFLRLSLLQGDPTNDIATSIHVKLLDAFTLASEHTKRGMSLPLKILFWHDVKDSGSVKLIESLQRDNFLDLDLCFWSEAEINLKTGSRCMEYFEQDLDEADLIVFLLHKKFLKAGYLENSDLLDLFYKANDRGVPLVAARTSSKSQPKHELFKNCEFYQPDAPPLCGGAPESSKRNLERLLSFLKFYRNDALGDEAPIELISKESVLSVGSELAEKEYLASIATPVEEIYAKDLPSARPTETPTQEEFDLNMRPRILVVATEWESMHGGLSTFNRELCSSLASLGAAVVCYVPTFSEPEKVAAADVGVSLISARELSGADEATLLRQRPEVPDGFAPDILIGHDRITGASSVALARDHFPESKRVLFIHTSPEEIEWHKEPREESTNSERANHRKKEQLALAENASLVATVGSHLYREFATDLVGVGNPVPIFNFLPGVSACPVEKRRLPESIRCLVLGRAEDYTLKGLDIASRAFGEVVKNWQTGITPKIVVRGAPIGTDEKLRNRIREDSGHPALDIVIRNYTADADEIQNDLRESSLVLMPSKKEGFGLVGLEAISLGIPTLVSSSSGLAEAIESHAPQFASDWVLPVTDDAVGKWANRIEQYLRARESAFARAAELRGLLTQHLDWKISSDALLLELQTL